MTFKFRKADRLRAAGRTSLFVAGVSAALLAAAPSWAQSSVLTHHNDNSRTGANLNEKILNTTNVNVSAFGRLFSREVDGQIYAQPLYVSGVTLPGHGKRNIIYVATMHNTLYAFDADDRYRSAPYWSLSLGAPRPSGFPTRYGVMSDIQVEIGALPTPVIDPATNTIYVANYMEDSSSGPYHWMLHAIDIVTGAEKLGGPVEIKPSCHGSGAGSVNGVLTFDPSLQNLRPALTLSRGVVYVSSASFEDTDPYHGWIAGYRASDLAQVSVFNTTPDGDGTGVNGEGEGGLWMAGEGLTVDTSGNLYCSVGNGVSTVKSGGTGFGESFVKLSPTLQALDYFMPFNADQLNRDDEDLGCSGVLGIPGSNLIVGGGKEGKLYLVDKDQMGHYNAGGDSNIVESWQAVDTSRSGSHHIHGVPAYYDGPTGRHIYLWGENDYLRAFAFDGSVFNTTPSSQSTVLAPQYSIGMPGGFLSISANGAAAGTGIVWALTPLNGDAGPNTVDGILRAFDANDLSKELWNSNQYPTQDMLGKFAKFVPPTVANGKVYAATFSNKLVVYGLLPAKRAPYHPGPAVVAGHIYWLRNSLSGLVLDDPAASRSPVQLIQWGVNGGENQEWRAVNMGNSCWKFENVSSHLSLKVAGASTDLGAAIEQNVSSKDASEQWILSPVGDGTYKIVNRGNGLLIDDAGASLDPGTGMLQWYDNGGSNQHWTFERVH
ncbi:hypothetical protein CCAX7_007510 [Capsulimonas corticalis]|uniref:Uncharacterized protein n=1 Tax=Capsulimonas corticalis TaxID=2219043 RepID=A0A402D1M8_9BACT|nr:RICIN domain-containing protein [Capsulimonas corticalis]BDI28700.1 hypothetical protein CCAX7_007510 [Capsulimonas corticalis]